ARGYRRRLPVGLHDGARACPAQANLRDIARPLWLPCCLKAKYRRTLGHQRGGYRRAVGFLSRLGAPLDHSARRLDQADDLYGRPLHGWDRSDLQPLNLARDAMAGATGCSQTIVAVGASRESGSLLDELEARAMFMRLAAALNGHESEL